MPPESSASEYLSSLSGLFSEIAATDHTGSELEFSDAAASAVDTIRMARSNGRKVILVGNGGSAAVVSHVQNDLVKAVGVRALVFTEQPLLTALANDEGYDAAYERPAQLWADTGDLLIAVSSSGNSENILSTVRVCRGADCKVVTLSGFDAGNPLRGLGHLNFYVPSSHYGLVETAHAALTHYFTDAARD